MIIVEKVKDPKAPEIVFFGLIFVNFGPLIILPTKYPPISDAIHPKRITNISIFKCIIFENKKNKKQNMNIKIIKRIFVINFFILLLDNFLFISKIQLLKKYQKLLVK